MKTVTFHPQAWVNDYAVPVDPEGATEFQVDDAELVGLKPDTFGSDNLQFHRNAPKWIQDWSGPFYIDWEVE